MASYRLYRLDGTGKIATAEWLEATDDADAEQRARSLGLACTCEIWDRNRLVARLEPGRK